jgi:hypothetical protein
MCYVFRKVSIRGAAAPTIKAKSRTQVLCHAMQKVIVGAAAPRIGTLRKT